MARKLIIISGLLAGALLVGAAMPASAQALATHRIPAIRFYLRFAGHMPALSTDKVLRTQIERKMR